MLLTFLGTFEAKSTLVHFEGVTVFSHLGAFILQWHFKHFKHFKGLNDLHCSSQHFKMLSHKNQSTKHTRNTKFILASIQGNII